MSESSFPEPTHAQHLRIEREGPDLCAEAHVVFDCPRVEPCDDCIDHDGDETGIHEYGGLDALSALTLLLERLGVDLTALDHWPQARHVRDIAAALGTTTRRLDHRLKELERDRRSGRKATQMLEEADTENQRLLRDQEVARDRVAS